MKIFIDTANIEEIKEASQYGILSGVTTNPSLIAKEKGDFKSILTYITGIVNGPISAEVISLDSEGMIKEGIELSKIHENIVIKLPTTLEGLKACNKLNSLGIKTNLTLIFTLNQALLAARAGATYVSPFIGRLEDVGVDGIELIKEIRTVFELHNIKTQIISASIRNPYHVKKVSLAGSHIATVPFKVIQAMIKHSLTDAGIKKFISDWENKTGNN